MASIACLPLLIFIFYLCHLRLQAELLTATGDEMC